MIMMVSKGFHYCLGSRLESETALDVLFPCFPEDIALIEPNPVDWGGWLVYLLEQMEGEAIRRRKSFNIDKMIKSLQMHFDQ